MTSFDGEAFEYDSIGNPVVYRNKNLVWTKGRQLTSIEEAQSGGAVGFTYDSNGLRTSKTIDGITKRFIYENGKLLRQTGINTIDFIYGSGGIIGIKVDTANYIFRKNLQGDVTHIYSESGALVGQYEYSAFGECEILLDINGIASLNPIRYRSYYFDSETNLYYLKSRYFDPETGRFINIDSLKFLAPDTINGLNLYAYCCNNPVMYIDPNGQFGFLAALFTFLFGILFMLFLPPDCERGITDNAITILKAVLDSIVFEGGIGVGLGAEVKVNSILDADILAKMDVVSVQNIDGIQVGIYEYVGAGVTLEDIFNLSTDEINVFTPYGKDPIDNSGNANFVIGVGAGVYVGIGGTINVGFDVTNFIKQLKANWK